MSEHLHVRVRKAPAWVQLGTLLAVWLMASPFLLAFEGHLGPTWNDMIVGLGTLLVIGLPGRRRAPRSGHAALLIGLWVLISPWALGYSHAPAALWNSVIVGITLATVGVTAARVDPTGHRTAIAPAMLDQPRPVRQRTGGPPDTGAGRSRAPRLASHLYRPTDGHRRPRA